MRKTKILVRCTNCKHSDYLPSLAPLNKVSSLQSFRCEKCHQKSAEVLIGQEWRPRDMLPKIFLNTETAERYKTKVKTEIETLRGNKQTLQTQVDQLNEQRIQLDQNIKDLQHRQSQLKSDISALTTETKKLTQQKELLEKENLRLEANKNTSSKPNSANHIPDKDSELNRLLGGTS